MTQTAPRNLLAGTFVLLLHVAFVSALIFAMNHQAPPAPMRIVQIFLHPRPRTEPIEKPFLSPLRLIYAPHIAVPRIEISPEAPAASSLEGVGRALFGCSPDALPNLSPEQRAKCPQFSFGRPKIPTLQMDVPDENSPFAQVIAKRNAPAVPMEHACGVQESPQANLGLPCFSFSGGPATQAIGGR